MSRLISILMGLTTGLLIFSAGSALAFNPFNGACSSSGASQRSVCQTTTSSNPLIGPGGVINKIVNIISIVGGIAAVIIIIVGGLEYVTSGGDPQRTNTAKNTILFAIIGVVVIALAQIIVNYVLYNIHTRI